MAPLIRFGMVEIDSHISFAGKKRRTLKHPVRSLSLIPKTKSPEKTARHESLPEIFWQ